MQSNTTMSIEMFNDYNQKNYMFRHLSVIVRFPSRELKVLLYIYTFIHSFIIHQYSALEVGLAGTRAQSCDRYGFGTLHPGQVLGGSLPLISPAFRRSHFRRQVPVRPQRRERPQQRKVELWARNLSGNFCLNSDFHVNLGYLLHAVNLRHGTDGFTSPPKEGVLRIFSP